MSITITRISLLDESRCPREEAVLSGKLHCRGPP